METGQTLLRSKKYPYALFFGHLALEKILKATVVKRTGEHAPYSHSLVMLAQRAGLDVPEEMLDRLAWRVDARLHPVPLSSSAFSEDTWVPLIHEVRSTGIEIH